MNFFQVVIFSLDKGEYGVDISCVQEIIRIPDHITKIPNVPSYVEGIFNLRGKVVYAIDLKKRFHYENSERGVDSRLLILKLKELLVGIIVDDVSDVMRIEKDSMESFCTELEGIGTNSIMGIYKSGEHLIMVLDSLRLKNEVFQNIEEGVEDAV